MECQRKYAGCKGIAEVRLKDDQHICRNCLEHGESRDIVDEL